MTRSRQTSAAILPNDWHTGAQQHHIARLEQKLWRVDGFFESLGEAVGSVIRFIVEGLSGFFGLLGGAVSSFIAGMSKALG